MRFEEIAVIIGPVGVSDILERRESGPVMVAGQVVSRCAEEMEFVLVFLRHGHVDPQFSEEVLIGHALIWRGSGSVDVFAGEIARNAEQAVR